MIKTSPPNLLSSLYVEAHSKSRREDDGHLRELCGEAHDTILALREAARKAEETLRLGRAFAGVSAAEFGNWCGHADLVEQELRAALGSIPARGVEPGKCPDTCPDPFAGGTLHCRLKAGHAGMHADPATGSSWGATEQKPGGVDPGCGLDCSCRWETEQKREGGG
jgi:hypothetical protein